MPSRPTALLPFLAAAMVAGCVSSAPASGDPAAEAIQVDSSATACTLSRTEASSGPLTFSVHNSGDEATEFYLLAEDAAQVIGEVENIGPGLTRDLVVQVAPGAYVTACKPGMAGDGIQGPFTVTDSGAEAPPEGNVAPRAAQAGTAHGEHG